MAITPLPRGLGNTYVIKGQIEGDYRTQRISLFDGRFDTAYRIIEFIIAPKKIIGNSNQSCSAKLCTEDQNLFGTTGQDSGEWNWQDNREIGWATWAQFSTNISRSYNSIIDPENLIIEDLFIGGVVNEDQPNNIFNYMIVMEKYSISQAEGTLTYIRNRGQALGDTSI
ncbi:unnamed protein product [marine sediment metagenome]|uniref:Uncharacterized protein n=1 Tax=marine sediment metagenome TaxID=412755 RepID=X1TNR0_9ZZZZ